jgi:aspartate/methionine/tyrosine aminotransferase
VNPLYETMPVSVFERMSLAAAKYGAVNLGQGFPDFGWPEQILDAAARALRDGSNQYAPSRGLPQLREAIAAHYRRHFGQPLDPGHVCVTSGATEALGAMILSVVNPGNEVIILTPAYDSYAPMIRRAGGEPVEVALQPPRWSIDREALEAALSDRTRAILFNNPHNPTSRLFDADELQIIADVAIRHDLTVIGDEVWEHVLLNPSPPGEVARSAGGGLYARDMPPPPAAAAAATSPGGRGFVPIATLPGMAERTLKAGSAGKIFSLTGWKVGWIVASPPLAVCASRAHQFLTFSTAPNLQSAVAYGLDQGDAWLGPMRERFTRALDRMSTGLRQAGYAVLKPASTYFLCVDLRASGIDVDDEAFARAAVEQAGVAVVPISAFAEKNPSRHLVRLCFAKRDETIDAGVEAMARARTLFA